MPTSSAEAIRLTAVSVDFAGTSGSASVSALVDLDLTVRAGERVALLGASGAGKSTLLDVIAGLVQPTSGSVEVLDTRIAELGERALRRHRARVGVVRQHHGLPASFRVIHNVNGGRLGSWSTPRALASLIKPHGRGDVDRALSAVGLDGLADRRTGDLSGGQQQRVAVARSVLQRPALLLADEPVSAVDPKLSNDVLTLVCDRSATERTTVVSLHDPGLARQHVDRVIGLRLGRMVFDVDPHDLSNELLDALYRSTD